MIYKTFEFSKSLNGTKIFHIARNRAGAVIFREESENKLKKAIDAYFELKEKEEELADKARQKAKLAAERAKKRQARRGLFQAKKPKEEQVAKKAQNEKPLAQKTASPRKKHFWG